MEALKKSSDKHNFNTIIWSQIIIIKNSGKDTKGFHTKYIKCLLAEHLFELAFKLTPALRHKEDTGEYFIIYYCNKINFFFT